MSVTINLPSETEGVLRSRAEAAGLSAEDYALSLISRGLGVSDADGLADRKPLRAITENIAGRFRDLPGEPFDEPRPDGASQHDHYIYGTPKRDDL